MFSEGDTAEVARLVGAAEARTSSEVAVVWTPRADDYALVRGLWSVVVAAVVVAEVGALELGLAAAWLPGLTVLLALVLYLAFGLGPLLRLVVPRGVLSERVHRRAQVAFLEFGVTETAARGGVLLFLSQAEHQVEILADRGIVARVEPSVWQSIVDELIQALRRGETMPGVRRAIERIGDLLEREFPRDAGDRNELGDAPQQLPAR